MARQRSLTSDYTRRMSFKRVDEDREEDRDKTMSETKTKTKKKTGYGL
jgi:hypothetical protein